MLLSTTGCHEIQIVCMVPILHIILIYLKGLYRIIIIYFKVDGLDLLYLTNESRLNIYPKNVYKLIVCT